jgi:hypothetical protein
VADLVDHGDPSFGAVGDVADGVWLITNAADPSARQRATR